MIEKNEEDNDLSLKMVEERARRRQVYREKGKKRAKPEPKRIFPNVSSPNW